LHSDKDAEEDSEGSDEASDSEVFEAEADSDDVDDEDPDDFGIPEGFGMFLYQVDCPRCDESFQTEMEACLREVPTATLNPDQIGLFQSRVRDCLDDDFYHSEPFGYDDLEGLSEFFDRHSDHAPVAKLVLGSSEGS
jgi:hypothetical protein